MFHYLYTNDMRVTLLDSKAQSTARMILEDSVPTATQDKSANNNANTMGFYLSLSHKGNCAKLAEKGDIRRVVLNFIKTFQYPNPRTIESFQNAVDDGIVLAPLREIIKVLFLFYQTDSINSYLTKDEIVNFIFYNKNIALNQEKNRTYLIEQIKEYRISNILPSNIAPDDERFWKHGDRQINELLSVIEWSGYIKINMDRVYLIVPDNDDFKYKAELLDIILFDEYWNYNDEDTYQDLRKSYFGYCDSQLLVNSADFEDYRNVHCNNLDHNIQRIYYGAPGTGKSFEIQKLVNCCYPEIEIKDNPFAFTTTLYSDYSYYNFIGSIMPTSKNGEIGYRFKAGILTEALARAYEYKDKDIFLIIEEMSRGDIASVFGDIFQLLDRDNTGVSEYSINNELILGYLEEKGLNIGNKVFLPKNLHILGTVNTSDQNVNVIDTAFKRRFDFVYVDVNPARNPDGSVMNEFKFKLGEKEYEWNRLYLAINKLITTKLELGEDKQLGQFFIKFGNYVGEDKQEQAFKAIQNKLLHYLWDDVQGASLSDDNTIFKKQYNSFSSVYKDFGDGVDVFSEDLILLYDRQSV